jgi:hypothetical protein
MHCINMPLHITGGCEGELAVIVFAFERAKPKVYPLDVAFEVSLFSE